MKLVKALCISALVLAVGLSGCLGGAKQELKAPPPAPSELSKNEQQRLEILAKEVRNFSLPGSKVLPAVTQIFNGTIGNEANTGVQDRNDRGGNNFNVPLKTFDISSLVPEGQPTALRITLIYFGQPGSGAKADIYACVPGYCSAYTTDNNDQFNWKATVQQLSLVTIGVAGQKALVGVSEADGIIANDLPFELKVEATYFHDVLTPYYAYAFNVPQGASGITLRSVKSGQEHILSKFVILDPAGELVSYTEYNDIAVLSESIFIPVRQPGQYVFYAEQLEHGFLSLETDAPLGSNTGMKLIEPQLAGGSLGSSPAPGVPERDLTGGACVDTPLTAVGCAGAPADATTPYNEGTKTNFAIDQGFPVELGAKIAPGATGAAEVRLVSGKGEVYRFQRMLRYDDTDKGSVGYTRDEANTKTNWANLAKGAYTASIVNDGVQGEITWWAKVIPVSGASLPAKK